MTEITVFAAGDVINYRNARGTLCAPALSQIVKSADYSVFNFEAPIQGYGSPLSKPGSYHSQRAETLVGMKQQGFDAVLLANNHIMDFGAEGLRATLRHAGLAGIDTVGAGATSDDAYAPLIREIRGLRVGIVNAGEAQFGVADYFHEHRGAGYAWINSHKVDQAVLHLRRTCDFVLVFAHAGLENYSIPQKEWRARYKHLCALGADVVVGSHPHVPQGYEAYGDSLIFYSLGNFYFDSDHYVERRDATYSVLLSLSTNRPVSFEAVFHHKVNGEVHLAQDSERIDLRGLCEQLEIGYEAAHDRMSIDTYHVVQRYLRRSLSRYPFDRSVRDHVKTALKWMRGQHRKEDMDLMALHVLRNEAYYFAARHALELKAQEKYGGARE